MKKYTVFSLDQLNYCSFIPVIFKYCDFTTMQYQMGNHQKLCEDIPSMSNLRFMYSSYWKFFILFQ